jgi:hypothetical protein
MDPLMGDVTQPTGITPPFSDNEAMAWQSLSLMFDPTYFLSMTHDELPQ